MSRRCVLGVSLFLSGFLLATGCGDPPTRVGDVCQLAEHCGGTEASFELICDNSIPGGACTVEGCTPDDLTTLEVDEDDGTCPDGSRCVREGPEKYRCRRSCGQQSECGEVIVCRERCETVDDVETCSIECKNEMECSPFWDMDRSEVPEDAPRACILKGRLHREPQD